MLRSFALLSILSAASTVVAYDVPLLDTDYSRQICSGMWSNSKTYLNGMRPFRATCKALLMLHKSASTALLRAR